MSIITASVLGLAAVLLAFILGLCMSSMRGKELGGSLYNGFHDFSAIIDKVLHVAIVPLLPLYICGTFVDMTRSGKTSSSWASCGRYSWSSSSCT